MSALEIEAQLPLVFDASAFIVLLQRERGADCVRGLLQEARTPLYTHALAVCELYSHLIQTQGAPIAHAALEGLKKAGIEVRTEMDADFWQQAGRFKAIHPFLALSDCFAIGLARRVGGEIVTANHVDFDILAPLGLCGIALFDRGVRTPTREEITKSSLLCQKDDIPSRNTAWIFAVLPPVNQRSPRGFVAGWG